MKPAAVALPLIVPLATALVATAAAGHPRVQRAVSLAGALALLLSAVWLAVEVDARGEMRLAFGGWAPPFAIEFAADRLSAALVLVAAVLGVAALVFQLSDADRAPEAPTLYPLIHGFLAGTTAAFLTADLFNLYVWLEVVLVASLGLLAVGSAPRHLDATFRYFVLNVVGTLVLLAGVAYVYALTGHLNYRAIAAAVEGIDARYVLLFAAVLLAAFLVKAAAFPVFAWLPASYHTLPAPIVALFAGLGTKVGVYIILRMHGSVFAALPAVGGSALGWIGAATMVTGVLGAASHWDMRRILAFQSISEVGYMLVGIALATPIGAQATLVFAVHHSLVKASLFLIAAIACRLAGSYDVRQIGGLAAAHPWLGALFLVQALSLAGIPPLSGFWAKLLVVRETLVQGHAAWAITALGVGLLTLYSMLRIWIDAFWKPHPVRAWRPEPGARLAPAVAAVLLLAGLSTVVSIWPEPLIRFARDAGADLMGARTP